MKMEKLSMCRICLVQNVRMYVVVNKSLQELYETLTDVPFVTEDRRPMLACFFCCAKIKQCAQFQRRCVQAEQLFTQMLREEWEPNPLINRAFCGGFIKTAITHLSIEDECQTENKTIKDEPPAVCETKDDNVEPEEEHYEFEQKYLHNSYSDVKFTPPRHSQPDSEDISLIEVEIGVKEEKVPMRKLSVWELDDTKTPKLDLRNAKPEKTATAKQKKNKKAKTKIIRNIQNGSSETVLEIKEPYECETCHRTFKFKSTLTSHYLVHTGEQPFKCELCQHCFSRKSNLALHSKIHAGEKPYKCSICQCTFSQSCGLKKHISRIHTDEKPFKCDICQCCFSTKDYLTNHKRTHSGDKPYQCEKCPCSFSQKSNLTKHIRVHSGDGPYKCQICQCSFKQKGNLTNHIRMHTGEKPFKCEICQCCFSQRGNLIKHNIREHSGEKKNKGDVP